jgi:putative tryptophan/tyrosine transport system substrate-binding protein
MTDAPMRRREFITLLGGAAAAWPYASLAQPGPTARLVAILWAGIEPGTKAAELATSEFVNQARDLGWVEGRNLRVEHRWTSGDAQQVATFAKELVDLRPNVIVVNSTPLLAALMRATREIPIVFVRVADPVGQGLIASIARPGGNATGFTNFEFSMGGKWLQLLKEVAPRIGRVVVLFNPKTMPYELFLRSIQAGAPAVALEVHPAPAQNTEEIERVINETADKSKDGLLVLPDIFTINVCYRDAIRGNRLHASEASVTKGKARDMRANQLI